MTPVTAETITDAQPIHAMFTVRVVDVDRHVVTIVCETCGLELPFGAALHLIDVDAAGFVMLEHMRSERHQFPCNETTVSAPNK